MKLLISGANGQLGTEWVQFCQQHGIPYSAYSRATLDVTDPDQVDRVLHKEQPEVVINCAAYTKVDKAEEEEALAKQINTVAVGAMAKSCKYHRVLLVHYSTDYVFSGTQADREQFPQGYPEEHQTSPQNTYGLTKRDGEVLIQQSGCEHLILRVSWLCGAYGPNFVKTMLRLAEQRDELNVVNDQFGSPTFTKNVVEWTYKLLEKKARGVVHLSSSGITNWYEFAQKIFELRGLQIKVNPVDSSAYKTAASRPLFSKLNTQKFTRITGIEPLSWQSGLEHLLNELEVE